jgi:signal transduction histidine kinase
MDIGIFDHLDRRDMPLDEFYESRLRLLERYDAAGFYSYHLAEHHATPLGLAPSPGIFIAAATQRTRHIRLGPCVYCLPLYDPLRLIEEVCMLDQLSRGRFDFGVGRGIVPYEMAYFNLHHMETEEIYREGLEVILQGLTSEVLDHRGPRYTYRKVPMILRPFQTPHPPLWYGLGHMAGAEWAATNRVNVIANNTADAVRPLLDRYREVWQKKHGGDAPLPKLGVGRHIVVAPTEAQAEARRSERLAALGQLSAGLAHEIRNPLGVIKGSAETLNRKLENSNPLASELAGYISSEVNRASALVTRFLDFARPLRPETRPQQVTELIDQALKTVADQWKGGPVVVERAYQKDLPPVPLDENLCEQVFLNLVQNAYEAMDSSGGTFRVEVSGARSNGRKGVQVRLSDTGPGVPVEMREQIFNPFVTTKKTGVGLGLSIVSKIVDEHHGTIRLENTRASGASFVIFFPAEEKARQRAGSA